MAPSRFTKVKIAIGYSLLLAILLFSLVFVHREMETLSASDDQQSLMTDSLLVLLREKDKNTIQMLRVLSEANDSLLSAREIEEIIAEQDSVVTQQRVQHRIILRWRLLPIPSLKRITRPIHCIRKFVWPVNKNVLRRKRLYGAGMCSSGGWIHN